MSFYPTSKEWEDKILKSVMKRIAEADNAFPRFQGGVSVGGMSQGGVSMRKYKKAPGVKRSGGKKMTPWVDFVKQVWKANPGMSYKDAMVAAGKMRRGGVSVGGKKGGLAVKSKKTGEVKSLLPERQYKMMLPPPAFEDVLAEMPEAPPAMGGSRKKKLASYHALVREVRAANPQMSYNQAQKEASRLRKMSGGVVVGGAAAMRAEEAVEPPRMGVSDSRTQRAAKGRRQTAKAARDSKARAKMAKSEGGVVVGGQMDEDYMRQHIRAALMDMAKEGGVSVGGVKAPGKKAKMPKTAISRQRLAEIMSGRV